MVRLSLFAEEHPLSDTNAQLQRLKRAPLPYNFSETLARHQLGGELRAARPDILQVNLGKKCNQSCHHCHVDAGPDRQEVMSDQVMDAVLRVLGETGASILDITGGAPELHPRFEELVRAGVRHHKRVLDRCNLTILRVPKYRHLPQFFADHRVEVISSLPCYGEDSVDNQRGEGVYTKSIEALLALNEVGYGMPGSGLVLTLVANPVGAYLPPAQHQLEAAFRRELRDRHGLEFTHLITLTNMPISRFLVDLEARGETDQYLHLLAQSFNPRAAVDVMCRNTVSVGYDGQLYDCDFNQMLGLNMDAAAAATIFDWDDDRLAAREIRTGNHCFGCTAGQGSSCGGALTA